MIGWVYEQDRQKVREAEKDLDDFYRQDAIDDLNNAKDAELQILDDRIKNWQNYLEMLEEKYNEFNVLQEQRLLMELLGVESEEQVYELIKNDMLDFNQYVEDHTQEFFDNQHAAFMNFDTIFNEFMANYKSNLEELRKLTTEAMELLNAINYYQGNGVNVADNFYTGTGVNSTILAGAKESYVMRNGEKIKSYIYNNETYDEYGNRFNFQEGDISHTGGGDYIWTQQKDGSFKGVLISNNGASGNKPSSSPNSSSKPKGTPTTVTKDNGEVVTAYIVDGHTVDANGNPYQFEYGDVVHTNGGDYIWNGTGAERLYASGILNGPVTYTGLAMLHGTPSQPEYVLNSDQAYNLLRYMSTNKPSFTSNGDAGTQYVLNGDIILNEVENAAEFWNEVTMAMDRRISVTKNNR